MHSSTIFRLCFLLQIAVTALSVSAAERCHPQDKKALLQIKNDLNNPAALSSWNRTTDCCDGWQGVDCDNGQNYRVYSLTLSNMDIHPRPLPIPPSVASLPYLNFLYIIGVSNLTGPIPRSITTLANLHYLKFSNTSLSGTIPEFLSQLSNLFTLELSYTNLSGVIPPSLSQMPNLEGIIFDGNSLSGSIPDSFGSFSNNFTSLSLSDNRISGQIPKSLGKLNLAFVYLNGNLLEGDASMLFGSEKNALQEIDLSRNRLAFDLGRVAGFSDELDLLDLSYNQIYGKVPEGIKSLKYLQNFNVSYNNLCGKIPRGGYLSRFDASSYLHNKCLCGTPLPSCRRSF